MTDPIKLPDGSTLMLHHHLPMGHRAHLATVKDLRSAGWVPREEVEAMRAALTEQWQAAAAALEQWRPVVEAARRLVACWRSNASDDEQVGVTVAFEQAVDALPTPPATTGPDASGRKGKVRDIAGQSFSRWTAVARQGNDARGRALWLCRCECGTEKVLRSEYLTQGKTRSCGCLRRDMAPNADAAEERNIWRMMLARCSDPDNKSFKNYGARGISVCERWLNFDAFLADMGRRPAGNYSIERENNAGNYEPGNCKWIPHTEQARNTRGNRLVKLNGEQMILSDAARRLGISLSAARYMLRTGKTKGADLVEVSNG